MKEKKIQFNYETLRVRIRLHSGSVRRFAKEIGMEYNQLISRLNGNVYFTLDEIQRISAFLGLSLRGTQQCFYTLQASPFDK